MQCLQTTGFLLSYNMNFFVCDSSS